MRLLNKIVEGCRRKLGGIRAGKGKKYETAAVLICLAVLCLFVSMKQGYHMDELLSFELANAEFNPWIVPTQPEGRLARFVHNEIEGENLAETLDNLAETVRDVLQNRGNSKLLSYKAQVYEEPVWIPREQFADYIQVDSDDAFNYLSVYFNVKDDNHPPLHFMLLHTVSSVFRGRVRAWKGCLINLAAAAGVMILLMKLGRRLAVCFGMEEHQRAVGIVCALLYGMSAGAVATVLLIRMYGILTLWCVAYFYLVADKWESRQFHRRNFPLILVTLLGFWTQYFFLFYCMCLAAVTAVLLLRRRRMRELWCFVRSMAISAVAGVLLFPFAVSDVFSSERGVEALGNLSAGLSGYGTRLREFLKILGSRTFSPLFWVFLLIPAVWALRLRLGKKEGKGRPAPDATAMMWLLVLPPAGYYLLAARMSPYLVDRYVMPIFPFVSLTGTLALFGLLSVISRRLSGKRARFFVPAACAAAVICQTVGLCMYDGSYLYRGYALQEQVAEENADYCCICIYDGVGYYENLPEFTHYKSTLLLTCEQLAARQDRESIGELDKVAVLVKPGCQKDLQQILDIMNRQYGFAADSGGRYDFDAHKDVLILMRKDG